MKPWIDRARETLSQIIDTVVAESKEEGENPLLVRVCFIGFRDHKDDERFSICPFTEDIQQLKEFMNSCVAEGGKDIPEDVVGGLKMCLMQDWTADSAKKVFMIGDAPCHGKKYTGNLDDHYPEGSPEGLTIEGLMKEFCKLDIEFSMIKLNNSVDAMIEDMRSYHQELDVKDMSDQTVEKAIADHVMVMPAAAAYERREAAYGGAEAEEEEMHYGGGGGGEEENMYYGGCGGGGGGATFKGKKAAYPAAKKGAMMKMAMDKEFADYAIKMTHGAVSKYKAKKKVGKAMYYGEEE